ncbi:MAG: tetratricopeptide repeat protein [Myxococcales bacterium]|nr:tetratricopeptide repeat protein [Myxococcales bacterium]
MRRARALAAASFLLLGTGCANKPAAGEAEEAGAALDQDPNLALTPEEQPPDERAQPEPDAKKKPKVVSRDRDPEEERRKMAESRKISANARQAQKVGNSVRATTLAREALRIHEQNAEAMLVLAEVFYSQSKYELALSVTSSVLQIDERVRTAKDTSMAHNLKGFAYLRMNKPTLATRSFREAAETDAKNATAWNNLGAQYLRTGNIKSAIDCFAYATRLDARFAKAYLNLGSAHRANRDWARAEKAYNEATRLQPSYPEAFFNLGLLYLDADPYPGVDTVTRLKKAIAFFNKFQQLASSGGGAATADAEPGDDIARVAKKGGSQGALASAGPMIDYRVVEPGKERFSSNQADLYIEIAQKGLERERKRAEREQKRNSKPAADTGGGDDELEDDADASLSSAKSPNQPAGEQPASTKPAKQPEAKQPEAKQPENKQPTPKQPAPKQPAPKQPAPKQPAPKQPAPKQPAPKQPAPKKPQTPTAKTPAKKPAQKPGPAGNQ